MATAWFLAQYKRTTVHGGPARYVAMNDHNDAIVADGGTWKEAECLGNYAVVKVRASVATLVAINADPVIRRLPMDRLNDPLSSLTPAQKLTLRGWIEALGYSRVEWQATLGTDLGAITLRQVLQFMLTRRLVPRYDIPTDSIVLDGAVQATDSLDDVDAGVQEG